jgi:hypothetical protein
VIKTIKKIILFYFTLFFSSRNIDGMTRVHAPVFKEDDYRPEALFERWKLYTRGVEGYSQGSI